MPILKDESQFGLGLRHSQTTEEYQAAVEAAQARDAVAQAKHTKEVVVSAIVAAVLLVGLGLLIYRHRQRIIAAADRALIWTAAGALRGLRRLRSGWNTFKSRVEAKAGSGTQEE